MGGLEPDERAELERLRREASTRRRGGRSLRWIGATGLLIVAALLGSLSVVAVYIRGQVLDTPTFVATVAPLTNDPAVRNAIAKRATDEIIKLSNLEELTKDLATKLESVGAPPQVADLVPPLVSGASSFLYGKIDSLLATQKFQDILTNAIRAGHDGLVVVLTGGQGKLLASSGDTVTIDLGAVVSQLKQALVQQGFGLFGKIPDFTFNYTLIQSDQLPKIRTYTRLLDQTATWLPWVALVILIGGLLLAPNRRRGIILAFTLLGIVTALLLVGINLARSYYVDNLPPSVQSPEAAAAVLDAVVRFLIASLQTLLVACLIFVIGGLLAGPSTPAVVIRRGLNRGLDGLAHLLTRTGRWFAVTGRALKAVYHPLQIAVVVLAVVGFILADQPGIATAIWTTVIVLAVLAVLEVFVRGARNGQPATPA